MREHRPSPVAAPHFPSVPAGGCQSRRDPALPGAAPELQGRGSMNIKRLWLGTAHQTASGRSLVCKSGRCFAFAFEGFFAHGRGNTSSNRYFWSAVLSVGFRSTGPKELKSSLKRQPSCHRQGGPGTALAGDEAAG